MKKSYLSIFAFFMIFTLSGCTEEVPIGFLGMKQLRQGLTGKVLHPGYHAIWGWDRLYLIDRSVHVKRESFQGTQAVLCADRLKFGVDVRIRARLRNAKGATSKKVSQHITSVLARLGAKVKKSKTKEAVRILDFDLLYQIYIQPDLRAIVRQVVSGYRTTQTREHRAQIRKQIMQQLHKSLDGTPMEIRGVFLSNFVYPKIMTRELERTRKEEMRLKREKAEQARRVIQAKNRLKLAKLKRSEELIKADTEAKSAKVKIEIISRSLSPQYLRYLELINQRILNNRVGPGDKVFFFGSGQNKVQPFINITPKKKLLK